MAIDITNYLTPQQLQGILAPTGTGVTLADQLGQTGNNVLTSVLANADNSGAYAGGSAGGTGTGSNTAQYDDTASQLRDLLSRTDTGLTQGLQQSQDEYDRQLGAANSSKDQQYANYADQRVDQNQSKLGAYNTINRNANTGYNSLAQIIGRAAGTGSSAYRELLPSIVGTDTSSKRQNATDTSGKNLAGIDKAQGQYDISFGGVLDDLLRQKKDNESSLRTGIEQQRQNINSQLAQNAAEREQALGGGYSAARSAAQPYNNAVTDSRNAVQSFFDQFRTPYTAKQAVAATPELSNYTTDRSAVNAQTAGGNSNNPYADILRKRIQGGI